jgi:hypothetical protein
VTAYWWAAQHGLPVTFGFLLELGGRAARLARWHGLAELRVHEDPHGIIGPVHTWPEWVFEESAASMRRDWARTSTNADTGELGYAPWDGGQPVPYRILVTGSRTWADGEAIAAALDAAAARAGGRPLTVVHGACEPRDPATGQPVPWARAETLPWQEQLNLASADWLADRIAASRGWSRELHPADWKRLGKPAGHARNGEMVRAGAGECLAFIRDHSPGASGCVRLARQASIPVTLYEWPGEDPGREYYG